MLLGNGVITNKLPISNSGGVQCNTNWNRDEIILGLGSFDLKSSLPDGYGLIGYEKAIKAGSISATNQLTITANASGAMGVTSDGTSSILISMANANGDLIVSGSGSIDIASTATGSIVASLNAVGSTSFAISMNHLAMYLEAYGFVVAGLSVTTTGTGTIRATATCVGSTIDTTGLTPASVWAYQDRTLTGAGGLSVEQQNQLNSIEAMTGIIPALL